VQRRYTISDENEYISLVGQKKKCVQKSFESPNFKKKGDSIREIYEDGSIYEGEIKKGLRNGKGKFTYAEGGVYEGD